MSTVESEIELLVRRMEVLLDRVASESSDSLMLSAAQVIEKSSAGDFARLSDRLLHVYVSLFESGNVSSAIKVGKLIAAKADAYNNLVTHRRILNAIGAQYCEIADFASAMTYLEGAVALARRLADPVVEAACLANVIAVLQEMGHYRHAISMARRVLELDDDSYLARMHKLQCASNGLFAAHRIGDSVAAGEFLVEGERNLSPDTEPLRRAFFERGRTLYLVDLGRVTEASFHLDETVRAIGPSANSRIGILLTISASVCRWASGELQQARIALEGLYAQSRFSKLYHHLVLQALIKVYSNGVSSPDAAVGLAYARELVEFTTSVKKAKFYRQIADRRENQDQRVGADTAVTTIDPFGLAQEWLIASDVLTPSMEMNACERRVLTKHEELTVIHDDMARLRAATLRREIRTDAVDTAENWAIAAEFFDDETGQHCYRVGHLASMLAREIGMDQTFCIRVEHAARLHDIGKIAVNEVILLKPGPLDAAEMAAMRLHTEVGAQLLSGSDDPTLMMAVDVARHHHEWWNGAGYPTRVGGRNIPISARICAFADVYDALTHARAYKKAWSHERALDEIVRLGGTQFDPHLIRPFRAVLERYRVDLARATIPGFADMDSNALIASRKKLMETIAGG